jgi:serine/threonine protein kinase
VKRWASIVLASAQFHPLSFWFRIMAAVFVSYSTRNQREADAVVAGLESRGIPCWIAPRNVDPGRSWAEAIINAIDTANAVVLLFSQHANLSTAVIHEIERAFAKGLTILAVRVEAVEPRGAMEFFLGARQWLDAIPPPPTQTQFDALAKALRPPLQPVIVDESETSGPWESLRVDEMALDPSSWLNKRVDQYRLTRFLGAGGMGKVYLAEHIHLGQEIAMKIAHPVGHWFPRLREVFVRSVRGLFQLSHPNIARIFNTGETVDPYGKTTFFLAMEYVNGPSLKELVGTYGRSRSLSEGLNVFKQICDGLQCAHNLRFMDAQGIQQVGILHGDIKPSNVMLTSAGDVRLIDFMMADFQEALDDPLPLLSYQDFGAMTARFGTVGYMAPEQSEQGTLTVRSDIFGLGALLFELFSGKRLIDVSIAREEKRAMARFEKESDAAAELAALNPALPPLLARPIFRATARNPGDRHGSVAELFRDMERAFTNNRSWFFGTKGR